MHKRGDGRILRKVSAIPIGVRYVHSWRSDTCMNPEMDTLRQIRHAAASGTPFEQKTQSFLITFTERRERRGDVIKQLTQAAVPSARVVNLTTPKRYFETLQQYMFVAAPTSHGEDTYRFWESVYAGSIPVTLHGPLDIIYSQFPCVLLNSWEGITVDDLARWKTSIESRFGKSPFSSTHVRRLLTARHWGDLIRRKEPTGSLTYLGLVRGDYPPGLLNKTLLHQAGSDVDDRGGDSSNKTPGPRNISSLGQVIASF